MSGTWLVVPTNRPERLEAFFKSWEGRGGWDRVVVVEDLPEVSRQFIPTLCEKFNGTPVWTIFHAEIEAILGPDAGIISKGDSACRCFGFLAAWWGGADYVLTLDDDCLPHISCENLVRAHRVMLENKTKWLSPTGSMRTRGLPYRNAGHLDNVKINVGLWTDNPDLDAPETLVRGNGAGYIPPDDTWIVPHGQYIPMCGMNLFAHRDALPLLYFPKMGQGSPYHRMDDIWAGVITKKCMDALGWSMSAGRPWVRHSRASDPFVNLEKEAPGIADNETFWGVIDAIDLEMWGDPFVSISSYLLRHEGVTRLDQYLHRLGECLHTWRRLFMERPNGLPLSPGKAVGL